MVTNGYVTPAGTRCLRQRGLTLWRVDIKGVLGVTGSGNLWKVPHPEIWSASRAVRAKPGSTACTWRCVTNVVPGINDTV